jgi:hypothetical protein
MILRENSNKKGFWRESNAQRDKEVSFITFFSVFEVRKRAEGEK